MPALLGDRIRKAREKAGMSQTDLARQIGITKEAMYLIESNRTRDPGSLKLRKIAQTLHVSADWLLELEPVGQL
jgi:transcriptional regulator with XRE-family HTH domain